LLEGWQCKYHGTCLSVEKEGPFPAGFAGGVAVIVGGHAEDSIGQFGRCGEGGLPSSTRSAMLVCYRGAIEGFPVMVDGCGVEDWVGECVVDCA
jgi:hypothetical protein